MVPRNIIGAPIAIVLAVCLIMLVVVADQILQREAIMSGDKVDARPWLAASATEDVSRCGKTRGEIGEPAPIPFPESPYCIAELVVPFCPARRKPADLIAAPPQIPRFRDHFDGRQHGILQATMEKPVALVEAMRLTRENST